MTMTQTQSDLTATKTDKPLTTAPLPPIELGAASQVAHALGLKDRQTVLRLHRAGRLPSPIQVGGEGHQRWRLRELRDWLNAGAPPARFWRWRPAEPQKLADLINERTAELNRTMESIRDARNELTQLDQQLTTGRPALSELNRQAATLNRT